MDINCEPSELETYANWQRLCGDSPDANIYIKQENDDDFRCNFEVSF
jgi:hypothetical protein